MKKGIIILGHGSKAKEAEEILSKIVKKVAQKGNYEYIGMASLQFNSPNLEEKVAEMAQEGVEQITIVPMFIFQGNHVKEDIPLEMKALQEKYPNIEIRLAKHMGADDRIADILIDRIKEATR